MPGKGKPLVFDDDLMTPPHLRMMNKILKNANVLPEWVQVQKEIENERNEAAAQRARLIREHASRRARVQALAADHPDVQTFVQWHAKSRESYLRRLKGVNTSILKFNIMAPSTTKVYTPYKVEVEMEAFDVEFPPLAGRVAPLPETPREDSLIKGVARARYQEGDGGGSVGGWVKPARRLGLGEGSGSGVSEGTDAEDIHRADVPEAWKNEK